MKDLQVYLRRGNIEGTLINGHGESLYIGPCASVKPYNAKHVLRWHFDTLAGNIWPFTQIKIHFNNEDIDVLNIKPFFKEDRKLIVLEYPRL